MFVGVPMEWVWEAMDRSFSNVKDIFLYQSMADSVEKVGVDLP